MVENWISRFPLSEDRFQKTTTTAAASSPGAGLSYKLIKKWREMRSN